MEEKNHGARNLATEKGGQGIRIFLESSHAGGPTCLQGGRNELNRGMIICGNSKKCFYFAVFLSLVGPVLERN